MTKAAITPGTQPIKVKMKVITILPHPLSYTAKGGNKILNITLQILIVRFIILFNTYKTLAKARLVPNYLCLIIN